jgi:hypothetical protein
VSAEAKFPIQIERRDSNELLKLRPTMHILNQVNFGNCKSTFSERVEEYCKQRSKELCHPCHVVENITAAAMGGSIDKEGHVIYPANYHFVNGTMIVDEFRTNYQEKSEAIGSALALLEQERVSRQMARLPSKAQSSLKSPVRYKVGDGMIQFEGLRSNWIFLTAKHLKMNRSLTMEMLMSRCVPLELNFTYDDLESFDDNPDLLFKPIPTIKVPDLSQPIPNDKYLEIREFVRQGLETRGVPVSYFFRTVNDCVRAYTFTDFTFDEGLFNYIVACKSAFASRMDLAKHEAEMEQLFPGIGDSL